MSCDAYLLHCYTHQAASEPSCAFCGLPDTPVRWQRTLTPEDPDGPFRLTGTITLKDPR